MLPRDDLLLLVVVEQERLNETDEPPPSHSNNAVLLMLLAVVYLPHPVGHGTGRAAEDCFHTRTGRVAGAVAAGVWVVDYRDRHYPTGIRTGGGAAGNEDEEAEQQHHRKEAEAVVVDDEDAAEWHPVAELDFHVPTFSFYLRVAW